jgi:Transposase DDE domain
MARQDRRYRRAKRKAKKTWAGKRRPHYRKNWLECQRHFMPPAFWQRLHRVAGAVSGQRWTLMATLMVAMMMMFFTTPSVQERLTEARVAWTLLYPHRRRVGKTVAGFLKALQRIGRPVLKRMSEELRPRIAQVLDQGWTVDGWVPFAGDGSRLALPRTAQLQRMFGDGNGETVNMWVTSLVHVPTGVPWAWRLGKATASERHHLQNLLWTLPPHALVLADAGFTSYELWQAMQQRGQAFLIRLSSGCHFYTDYEVRPNFREGIAYLWPTRNRTEAPLKLRLIRVPGKKKGQGHKHDVWLATNVLDSTKLSRRTAAKLYKMRWEQEVFYRSLKCTLGQTKLASRTVKQVVREAELAMVATQLLLAQAAWAMLRAGQPVRASAAKAVQLFREEMRHLLRRGSLRPHHLKRLGQAAREHRPNRTSSKMNRAKPKTYKVPGPPNFQRLTRDVKAAVAKHCNAA